MTVQEMHIAIDLGIQRLNTSVHLNLPGEAKDLYLNRAIRKLISDEIKQVNNTVNNIVTYEDIRSYFDKLAPLITDRNLLRLSSGYKYQSFVLPTGTSDYFTSGRLTAGVQYRVITAGATNLSSFGGATTPIIGTTFTCVLANVLAGESIVSGNTYEILTNSGSVKYNYVAIGAADNEVGTRFVATSSVALPLTNGVNTSCKTITKSPTWDGVTKLANVYSYDYDHYLSIEANVNKGSSFISGALVAGNMYKVVTAGTTNLLSYGHTTTPSKDYVFLCTLSGTPTWDGTTRLILTENYICRVAKSQDVASLLSHAYGTTYDSPIAEIVTNGSGQRTVNVYHDNKFSVNQITIKYLKKPDKVNIVASVNSNLHEDIHDEIVALAIGLIKYDDERLRDASPQQN